MYSKGQRIAAWIGIILLVLLYLATLIFAIFDFDGKGGLLRVSLFATIAIPILIWIYIWLYGLITHKHTIASTDYDFTAGLTERAPSADSASDSESISENTANES